MTDKNLKAIKKQMDKKVQKEMNIMDRLYDIEKWVGDNIYLVLLSWIIILLTVVVVQNYREAKTTTQVLYYMEKMMTLPVYFKLEE